MQPSRLGEIIQELGFAWFTRGDYNLNLVGVRSPRAGAGYFDDAMYCAYKVSGLWRLHRWPITTDPGSSLLRNPLGEGGTAILAAPQQMRGAYLIGRHKGRPALVQHGGPVKIWRDNNRDTELDWGSDGGDPGWYGINIHDVPSVEVASLNRGASAGCQVFACRAEHRAMMDLAEKSAARYGPRFTYTLICE